MISNRQLTISEKARYMKSISHTGKTMYYRFLSDFQNLVALHWQQEMP